MSKQKTFSKEFEEEAGRLALTIDPVPQDLSGLNERNLAKSKLV